MPETMDGQLLGVIWFAIREWIGNLTSKAVMQRLPLDRLFVA